MKRPAIFLDRDGVLNELLFRNGRLSAPWTLEEFQMFPGIGDAVRALQAAGYRVIVLTNQPDVAHGTLRRAVLDQMHDALRSAAPVHAIYDCPHTWDEACACKKPRPGMAHRAAQEHDLDFAHSYVVGDRPADVNLAYALGIPAVLVRSEATAWNAAPMERPPAQEVASLAEAVAWILAQAPQ